MKRILFILFVLFAFTAKSQTFTPIHNYQAPDGLAVIKYLGIPYGPAPALNVTRNNAGALFFKTTDSSLYVYTGTRWLSVAQSGGGISVINIITDSSISICNYNSCDTFITNVTAQLVTILNDTTLKVCDTLQNCDTLHVPRAQFITGLLDAVDTAFAQDNFHLRFHKLSATWDVEFERDSTLWNQSVKYGDPYLDPIWAKIDSLHTYKSEVWDSVYQFRNGDSSLIALILAQDGFIVTPQITWSGSGLTVDGTYGIYRIGNEIYNSPQGSVTFGTADATFGRYDVVAVDTTGALVVIPGTPSANPGIPQADDGSQLAVAIYYIGAGATTPTGASELPIFNENTGAEWIPPTASGPTINPNQSIIVFSGSKALDVGAFANGNSITFPKPSGTAAASDYTNLKMRIRLKSNLAKTANISVSLLNGTTVITPAQIPLTSNGLVKNVTGIFQPISILLDNLALTQNNFDKIRLNLSGANASGFYVDYMVLQAGNVPVNTTNNYLTNIYRKAGTDSIFKVVNGATSFAFIDSTGGGSPTPAALTKTDDTNVTATLTGTPTAALLQATNLALGWTGQLSVPRGGTGNSTFTSYSVITAGTTATGAFQNVSGVGTSGQVLTSNGAAALPTWQASGGGSTSIQKQIVASNTVTFTSLPATYADYEIFRWGQRVYPTFDYTASGNTITGSSWVNGDEIIMQRIK